MLRILIKIKKAYLYFYKNKEWILSFLFVVSIIKSVIWYGFFGINILSFTNIQDIFISFAEYFMGIIVLILIWIFYISLHLNITENKHDKKIKKAIKKIGKLLVIVIFIFLSLLFRSLFKMTQSVFEIILIFSLFYYLSCEKKKAEILYYSLVIILGVILIQPLEAFIKIKSKNDSAQIPQIGFVERNAHYDNFSFDYAGNTITTNSNRFFYIGSNTSYFFIFDKYLNKSLIIPKNECHNITSIPFEISNIRF